VFYGHFPSFGEHQNDWGNTVGNLEFVPFGKEIKKETYKMYIYIYI
jgi:hypothetical protein